MGLLDSVGSKQEVLNMTDTDENTAIARIAPYVADYMFAKEKGLDELAKNIAKDYAIMRLKGREIGTGAPMCWEDSLLDRAIDAIESEIERYKK
jgi:hypothetical protein